MASSIVVASGKGGVGKTSLAVNLGLTLARQGRRTILLDADFGMANAHILIGANPNRFVMFPLQDQEIWQHYKKMEDCFWRTEEIDLSKDLVHWKNLILMRFIVTS